ncbi:MAG: hypothetical protein KF861_11490, partial [Planctomycetaceae bacterium]|nr:hypothetical protein [Planctomycetaceae bacterium]
FEITGAMTRLFQEHVARDDSFRASFLGHVVTELLLDRVLHETYPGRMDRYYAAWESIDPEFVEHAVERMTQQPAPQTAMFLGLFQRERFLYDYANSERLLFRLNQVMHRVKLPQLPGHTTAVFDSGVLIVRQRWRELLPWEQFDLADLR